ncbi:hypothetical protein VCV18_012642 [Metarhizium anisopliae]
MKTFSIMLALCGLALARERPSDDEITRQAEEACGRLENILMDKCKTSAKHCVDDAFNRNIPEIKRGNEVFWSYIQDCTIRRSASTVHGYCVNCKGGNGPRSADGKFEEDFDGFLTFDCRLRENKDPANNVAPQGPLLTGSYGASGSPSPAPKLPWKESGQWALECGLHEYREEQCGTERYCKLFDEGLNDGAYKNSQECFDAHERQPLDPDRIIFPDN